MCGWVCRAAAGLATKMQNHQLPPVIHAIGLCCQHCIALCAGRVTHAVCVPSCAGVALYNGVFKEVPLKKMLLGAMLLGVGLGSTQVRCWNSSCALRVHVGQCWLGYCCC